MSLTMYRYDLDEDERKALVREVTLKTAKAHQIDAERLRFELKEAVAVDWGDDAGSSDKFGGALYVRPNRGELFVDGGEPEPKLRWHCQQVCIWLARIPVNKAHVGEPTFPVVSTSWLERQRQMAAEDEAVFRKLDEIAKDGF